MFNNQLLKKVPFMYVHKFVTNFLDMKDMYHRITNNKIYNIYCKFHSYIHDFINGIVS